MPHSRALFILLSLLMLSAPQPLLAEATLWQQGIALSAERILSADHDDIRIEQQLVLNSHPRQLWNILSDLRQYPQFFSFTPQLNIHREYLQEPLFISEFTAYQQRRAGPFIIEQVFFGVLQTDAEKQHIRLLIWQLDGLFIELTLQLQAINDNQTGLHIATQLTGDPQQMNRHSLRELSSPFFHADQLRALVEEGISAYTDCLSAMTGRYCF